MVTFKNGRRKGELQIKKALREGDEAYYNNEGFEFQVALQDPTKTAPSSVTFPENSSAAAYRLPLVRRRPLRHQGNEKE